MTQLLRFFMVGLANTIVGLLCIWGAMYFLGLNDVTANLVGYIIGFFLSFALHRSWTFAHKGAVRRSLPRWLAAAMLAYIINLGIVLVAHRVEGIDPYLAQPLGNAAYTAIMFLAGRYYVFAIPHPG